MDKRGGVDTLDLVLAGGGHAHVAVLRGLGMAPVPGLRVTLVCPELRTPYSGMLPGAIAGHYRPDEMHIDLRRLARFAGAAIVEAAVTGLDADARRIRPAGRPPLRYDLLSLNTGSTPALGAVSGAAEHAIPVKPVSGLLAALDRRGAAWTTRARPAHIAVVGGGAGGVELALALAQRFRFAPTPPRLAVFTRSETILPAHDPAVRARFAQILQHRGIAIHAGQAVVRVGADTLTVANGRTHPADGVLWATHAGAPAWLAGSTLALDETGFVRVDHTLRSVSHPQVFAAGDVAALPDRRPKSGVFAVRAGPVLAANLRRRARGKRLRAFRAQRRALALIATGDRDAVASRGALVLAGRWLWRVKDRIDRRFMARYSDLPRMAEPEPFVAPEAGRLPRRPTTPAMRCGGCGAKVGHGALEHALARLARDSPAARRAGVEDRGDAALFTPPPGARLVQSLDYVRDFVGDAYLLGEIAAQHALNDLYATGATPHSALVLAGIPLAAEALMAEQLYQLLAGATTALSAAGAALLGGHSSEAAELGIGFTVNGTRAAAAARDPARLEAGMGLILTKPLGTGVLFAADMRHRARGEWISAALGQMRQSAAGAAACLRRHGAVACTDVTGFGLVGHLHTLLGDTALGAALDLDALPVLAGAAELAGAGVHSSLYPQNAARQRLIADYEWAKSHPARPLLFDPQTAGGLLAAVPSGHARACVDALHAFGYHGARRIGSLRRPDSAPPIRLRAGHG